jgi:hypothetical protein
MAQQVPQHAGSRWVRSVLTIAKLKRWSINYYIDTAAAAEHAAGDLARVGGGLGEYYSERETRTPVWLLAGTWGVSVEEANTERSRLVDDSACPPPPEYSSWPIGHTYLDQRRFDKSGRAQLRLNLARVASRRKRLYLACSR